ncbi:MAG: hypothetical protein AAF735_01620 [Myxococcota bacterium]
MNRKPLFSVCLCFALLPATNAAAQAEENVKVAVVADRDVKKSLRASVVKSLAPTFQVSRVKYNPKGDLSAQAARWAKNDQADLVVHLAVRRKGRRAELRARVIEAATGDVLGEEVVGRGRAKRRRTRIAKPSLAKGSRALAAMLLDATEQVASADADYGDGDPASEDTAQDGALASDDSAFPSNPSSLDAGDGPNTELTAELETSSRLDQDKSAKLRLGVGFGGRNFGFSDFLFGDLREYEQSGAVLVNGEARWAPLQNLPLSLEVLASMSVVNSNEVPDADNASLDSTWIDVAGGVGYDYALGSSISIGVLGLARYTSFSFADVTLDSEVAAGAPDVSYLSGGGDLRVKYALEELEAELSVGGLYILSVGGLLSEAFPNTSGFGAQGRLLLTYPLLDWLEVGLDGQLRQFGLSFGPEVGTAFVAGGAEDRYWQGGVLFGFVI